MTVGKMIELLAGKVTSFYRVVSPLVPPDNFGHIRQVYWQGLCNTVRPSVARR